MTSHSGAVLVGVDGSAGDEPALQWAVEEASSRQSPVRLVHAYRWPTTYTSASIYGPAPGYRPSDDLQKPRRFAEHLVARAIDRAQAFDASVEVSGDAIDGHAVPVLIEESSRAALIVLGSRQRETLGSTMLGSVSAAVAARAECAAVVLRGPAGLPEEDPAVVVGLDGSEADELLLAFGFDYATRHRAPLRAVLCWHPDLLATMDWRMEPPAPQRAEAWLSESLAGWREKYPDVRVVGTVVRQHPASGLVTESLNQQLLVVGTRGRHALAGTLLGSVSQGVLHHALCPVAVLPTHRHATHP